MVPGIVNGVPTSRQHTHHLPTSFPRREFTTVAPLRLRRSAARRHADDSGRAHFCLPSLVCAIHHEGQASAQPSLGVPVRSDARTATRTSPRNRFTNRGLPLFKHVTVELQLLMGTRVRMCRACITTLRGGENNEINTLNYNTNYIVQLFLL